MPIAVLRFIFSLFVCSIALLLPYKLRIFWFFLISGVIHLPFKLFGAIAKFLIQQTKSDNPYEK